MTTPIKLLEKELKALERDLKKSEESFADGKIGKRFHEQHLENINPRIIEFRNTIMILKVSECQR